MKILKSYGEARVYKKINDKETRFFVSLRENGMLRRYTIDRAIAEQLCRKESMEFVLAVGLFLDGAKLKGSENYYEVKL